MKKVGLIAGKFIQLLLLTSILALSVFTKCDRNTVFFDQTTSMQLSNWEGSSFEADQDYLIEFFNPYTFILPLNTPEKKSNQTISFANHFPEIVIPPPNFSM